MTSLTSMQTGHPIARVATLPSTNANTVVLVCAGGSSVSVQAAPRRILHVAAGEGENGSSTHASSHPRGNSMEGVSATTAAEMGKGGDALLAAVQQWSNTRAATAASSSSSSSLFSAVSLSPEQRASLCGGEVASLCVAALPGTDTAIAVVGSTVGTVALFLVEGSRTLCKVAECALAQWSHGQITAQDAIVDVAFSMDPAGRPEFVSAASTGCVVVVDVQMFYRGSSSGSNDDDDGNEEELDLVKASGVAGSTVGGVWSRSVLRAKAVEALERPNAHVIRRSRSDIFTCAFAEANVVRVLAPQRLHAAVAMDVALVVVLSDGTLRYVERVVGGGSVRLLSEHHQRRFASGANFIAYGQDSLLSNNTTAAPSGAYTRHSGGDNVSGLGEEDSRALPHVIYRYRLSPHHMQVCQAGTAGQSGTTGGGGGGGFGGSAAAASAEVVTVVNDAVIFFSEKDAVCHLVVAGTQLIPVAKASSSSGAGGMAAAGAGSGGAFGGTFATASHRALGWWAVVHNAVLPRCTFDRASLERQAFQQVQRGSEATTSGSPNSTLAHFSEATAFSSGAGSPFMIHVQSNVMALPAASLNTTSMSATMGNGGRLLNSTGAVDASSCYDSVLRTPVVSSPTGTGAHVSAGSASGGVGCGFAAVTMVSGVLVLSAGADVYVGDVSAVSPSAKALPMLRPARSLGAVVEAITPGPSRDARSVLVTAGARVVPVVL